MNDTKPVIVCISAASGIIFGIRTIDFLLKNNFKVEAVFSEKAYFIAKQELNLELCHDSEVIKSNLLKFLNLNDKKDNLKIWLNDELWASPASGSYKTQGVVVSPASMATVAAAACGLADNLIQRIIDAAIKEDRKIVIVPRETPFSSIHLENMLKLSRTGVKIVPPVVGFYSNIQTIDDVINFVVGKTLDSFGIDNNLYKRWE